MKQFVVSIIIIILGSFIADRAVGELMWWVNQHTQEHACYKINKMVNDVEAEILLMGTSRCHQHYVPSIIKDTTGMSVYNGGINASDNIYAHYILLNLIFDRYKPDVICLEVSTNDFCTQEEPFNSIGFFSPYFGRNEDSDSIFRLAGVYWPYKLLHAYRYNAKATSSLAGLFFSPDHTPDDGYVPQPQPVHPVSVAPPHFECPINVDSNKLRYLQKFIDICKDNDILLVFTISPEYSYVKKDHYSLLKDIAMKNNIQILDYHTKGLFISNPELFHDGAHLWDKGASLYSSIFASDLKHIIDNSGQLTDDHQ